MSGGERGVGFVIPAEQRLQYTVAPQAGGRLTLKSVGGQLRALGKLLEAVAREDCNGRWMAVLDGIEMSAEGEIRFDVALLPEATNAKPKQENVP